jgi:uncharacterized protein
MQELNFKRIEIGDKQLFDKFFSVFQPAISEYTFTNLFMWSAIKDTQYARMDEGLVLKTYHHNEACFLPPIGYNDCQKTLDQLIEYGSAHGIRKFRVISEHFRKFLKHPGVKITADRDNYDYVYKTQSLASLKGWRLDGKRGFIKKFRENYEFRYVPYTQDYKKACLELYQNWLGDKAAADPSILDEWKAFTAFLENFQALGATGGVITVDGRLAGFTFGEKLNDNTFVVHYEKADTSFTGSYQMINQQFIQKESEGKFLFVNREQDLGIEGIRKAKLSYAPIRLVKKYQATF